MTESMMTRDQLIDEAIRVIKKKDNKFRMSSWGYPEVDCKTAHCIGGWISIILYEKYERLFSPHEVDDLIGRCYRELFFMEELSEDLSLSYFDDYLSDDMRKTCAIEVLRRLKKTGKVQWIEVLKENGVLDLVKTR